MGRISLVIGLAFLAGAILLGEFVAALITNERYGSIVQQTLVIGGWVALWRPLEIFLYDWWPIRAEARLHDRLSEMDVRLLGASTACHPRGRCTRAHTPCPRPRALLARCPGSQTPLHETANCAAPAPSVRFESSREA
ncbi:MAG: hypothetical protein ACHBNF_17505 [Chromatiales bacterium]